jgi:hypothetical protein
MKKGARQSTRVPQASVKCCESVMEEEGRGLRKSVQSEIHSQVDEDEM